VARPAWIEPATPAFVATFSIAYVSVFALILALLLFSGRHLADGSVDAIAASYPNTGYIGFPLGVIAFGQASLTPTTIATILVACVLFAVAIMLIVIGLQTKRTPDQTTARTASATAGTGQRCPVANSPPT
jgi:hypothetical protein